MNVLICDDDLKIVQQIKKFLLKLSKSVLICLSNIESPFEKQVISKL